MELNKYSKNITSYGVQPAAQAMLHAIGLKKEDFSKPFIGIASTGYEGNPCNMHLNDLSKEIKNSIVVQFPDSLNGERVGHTSSLYFAILEIVN